jgi:hypothetical protein
MARCVPAAPPADGESNTQLAPLAVLQSTMNFIPTANRMLHGEGLQPVPASDWQFQIPWLARVEARGPLIKIIEIASLKWV